ncbi:MAG: type III polyketide synthase [Cytophagales bacterium]|nr:type III polyketide synthase [Cytophaga sp.]
MSYIAAIETALPDYFHTQKAFASFYANSTDDADTKRKINIIASKTGIESRYSVLKDYSLLPNTFEFYAKNEQLFPEPSLTQRMDVFKKEAIALSVKAVRKIKRFETIKHAISHIITVTCTGLFAPGLDIELIHELGLDPTISRSSVNFMGCNAAILALKQADLICKNNGAAKVLIVCTELCTLHFQKMYNDDYILSNLLFGDGCAAVLVTADQLEIKESALIKINAFHSLILHNGYNDMAWQLGETGFRMNLTSYVSGLINSNIKAMLDEVAIVPDTVDYWAIHPGGKKIVDDFCEALELDRSTMTESYDVLKQYGNMSSPTVLFVLKQVLMKNNTPKKGETIFAAAFGPGLSIETMQLVYA